MKTEKLLIIILLFFGLISCSEDEIDTYGDRNYIFFDQTSEDEEYPVKDFSFIYENESVIEKVVEIPVLFTGKFYSRDRFFRVEVIDSLTTAVEGVHYEIENKNRQLIKPDSVGGNLLVKVMKTEEMNDSIFQIGVKIVSSEDFIVAQNKILILNVTNVLTEPDWWPWVSSWDPNLGVFTRAKAKLWFEFMGVNDGSDPWGIEPYTVFKFLGGAWRPFKNKAERNSSLLSFKKWLEVSPGAPYYDENDNLVLSTL